MSAFAETVAGASACAEVSAIADAAQVFTHSNWPASARSRSMTRSLQQRMVMENRGLARRLCSVSLNCGASHRERLPLLRHTHGGRLPLHFSDALVVLR